MERTGTLGMLDLKLVNERRMVQMSGKMLMASSSRIDGVMNSQAIARSDRPRMRLAKGRGVVSARRWPNESRPLLALMRCSPFAEGLRRGAPETCLQGHRARCVSSAQQTFAQSAAQVERSPPYCLLRLFAFL